MTELQDYLGVMYVLNYLAVEVAHKEVTSNARRLLGRKTLDVKMAQKQLPSIPVVVACKFW
jgi:hypothetical protein